MEEERRSLRVGLAVIALAAVFRLLSLVSAETTLRFFGNVRAASFLMYLETGRIARYVPPGETLPPGADVPPEATAPPSPTVPAAARPAFSPEDAELVDLRNQCGYEPDVQALLLEALAWELRGDAPAVLIVHTHASECYTKGPGEDFSYSSNYRTLDEDYNLLSVGDRVAEILEAGGVKVLHDRTLHDQPSYNAAYDNSRASVEAYLAEHPSIRMVLDIHRDAAETGNGQLRTEAVVDGRPSAQLMMVVGTDASGLFHPQWQENMALAIKLTAQLEKTWPGLTRPISFRAQRFNQDLSTGAMLVEVGAAGNSHEEALTAAEALAKAILALASGTEAA